ncbi:MAG: ABC transporter substrate-binding protein [Candidimonas sp.]|nr:MAG: ABC transporter substrate-binding protein [Candidimonas sp.]TAM25495.1 MAG: ABC transporter substrate-binding protein [Candidimonas sp.]
MNIFKFLKTTGVAALLSFAALPFASAQSASEPIKIGVPLPLTGPLAGGGRMILDGIKYAAEQANGQGGVLGRKIQLLIEDTKGEPNTAAGIAAKMTSQEKVFAIVGGYGSTPDFAMLQSVKRYKPIFVHIGSSAVKLEQTFGAEPWYYHVYIVDYHRQEGVTAFLNSITPRPKTVAIAYEDGLYGSDSVKFSDEYLGKAGYKIIMKEPFKAGSPDLSPILNRVKALNPDVFFFVGYSGDNIQIARQAHELKIKPKLTLIVAAGEKREDFGNFGNGIAVIGEWAPEQKTPGLDAFLKGIAHALPANTKVLPTMVMGYTGMYTLIQSIKKANTLDREKVLAAMDDSTFATPFGKVSYKASERGGKHQLLSEKNLVVWQYRKNGQQVVWPVDKANGKLVYPNN